VLPIIARIRTAQAATLLSATLLLLAGCGGGSSSGGGGTPPPPPPNFELSGKVMGGQLPVSGAQVQLYVVGSTGYGSGATLLVPAAVTDSTGTFSLSGNVTCPSSNGLTYVTATGGHTGTGSDNAAIGMMAALGTCSSLSSSTAVTVNEVTTVATVWALAPFLHSGGVMGTSSGNAKGLADAFATVNSLVTLSSGAAPGTSAPSNASIPTSKINTVAGILSACVEQTSASACSTLMTAATPAGGTAPTNTLDAALDIARNPGPGNAAALFALAGSSSPFQPILAAAPPDWTLAVNFTGGGLNTPGSIALDASGNVWVANYFNSVTEFSGTGTPISTATGFTGGGLTESYGLAVNTDNSVWVTDEQSDGSVNGGFGSVTVLNSTGQPTSGTGGYFSGGVYFPIAAAADTDGSVWIADYGDSTATKFSLNGTAVSPAGGFGASQLEGPVAVAIDANHNAWFVNQAAQTGSVTSISADGSKLNTVACGGDAPSGIATDAIAVSGATGHLWTANYYSDSVSELSLNSDGSVSQVGTAITAGGITHPNSLAVDGAGNVWVANYRGNSISELAAANAVQPGAALSPGTGLGADASLLAPFALAIDASGNVWVSNQGGTPVKQGTTTVEQYTVTEFLGAATPVKTPLLGPPQLP
jgi:sugar lactone lactonase YvrE